MSGGVNTCPGAIPLARGVPAIGALCFGVSWFYIPLGQPVGVAPAAGLKHTVESLEFCFFFLQFLFFFLINSQKNFIPARG